MNLRELDPTNPKFEPGRAVYVLLHEDESHIYPRPDGEPAWSYSKNELELTRKILIKDLGCRAYHVVPLHEAFIRVGNKQADLEKAWEKTINTIRKAKKITDRISIYRAFFHRTRLPHPLLFDKELKQLLAIEKTQG